MTPVELLVILVIAGVIAVLFYFNLEYRNLSSANIRSVFVETGEKARSTISGSNGNHDGNNGGFGEKMSGMTDQASGMGVKVRSTVSGAGEKITGSNVSEKMSGVSEKLKVSVKGATSTDSLSNKIDLFLEDKSDQLIKDWELATKDDISTIEKRYTKVTRDLETLDSRFNEFRGSTNKKLKKIEERLDKLEKVE
jgi:hypothetical protein